MAYKESPYERIVAVGWLSGFVGVLTLEYSTTAEFEVGSDDSPPITPEVLPAQATLVRSDYLEESILRMENSETIATVLATDELQQMILDDLVAGPGPGDPIFDAEVAEAEAQQGRSADIIFEDASWTDVMDTHTHPNGSQTTYRTGVVGDPLAGWWTYLWTHMETIEATFETIKKQDWFYNFGRSASDPAAVQVGKVTKGEAALVPRTYTARLRVYGHGASFEISGDGALSTELPTRYDVTKEWPSSEMNTFLLFSQLGFLGDITPLP